MTEEIWKSIKDFPDYEISNKGRVRSFKTGSPQIMRNSLTGKYPKVTLCKSGGKWDYSVHRLVLETFRGPCPEGMEGAHIDNDRNNNNLENLMWTTHWENLNQSPHMTSHSPEIRNDIRRRYWAGGITQKQLAKEYGYTQANISLIVNRSLERV